MSQYDQTLEQAVAAVEALEAERDAVLRLPETRETNDQLERLERHLETARGIVGQIVAAGVRGMDL